MIPAAFDYDVAESVEHAVELLSDGGSDTKLLAGGQSLIPALKLRIARPTKLVDLGRLDDLAYVRDGGTHVAIGALTRHAAVAADPLLAEHCPIVSTTAAQIGDPQVRSRGTLGGTMAHGDPASDMPAVMLALGADVVARGTAGDRVIPATEFFTGVFQSACAPDEVVVEAASFGTRTSTSTSSGARAVSKTPVKNSVAGMTRSPPFPFATRSHPRARTTAGMSDAGSPWASVPPNVPRLRTGGSPIWAAVNETIGQCSASRGSDATAACRVIAPTATCVPPSFT